VPSELFDGSHNNSGSFERKFLEFGLPIVESYLNRLSSWNQGLMLKFIEKETKTNTDTGIRKFQEWAPDLVFHQTTGVSSSIPGRLSPHLWPYFLLLLYWTLWPWEVWRSFESVGRHNHSRRGLVRFQPWCTPCVGSAHRCGKQRRIPWPWHCSIQCWQDLWPEALPLFDYQLEVHMARRRTKVFPHWEFRGNIFNGTCHYESFGLEGQFGLLHQRGWRAKRDGGSDLPLQSCQWGFWWLGDRPALHSLDGFGDWETDQIILSNAILRPDRQLCSLPKENSLWTRLKLSPRQFNDSGICFHGDLMNCNRFDPHRRTPCPWWHSITNSSFDDLNFLERVKEQMLYKGKGSKRRNRKNTKKIVLSGGLSVNPTQTRKCLFFPSCLYTTGGRVDDYF